MGDRNRKEAAMIKMIHRIARMAIYLLPSAFAAFLWMPCSGQEKTITQTAGVDNTRMGAYRALAQLAHQAFEKGDDATAAEFSRILERTWDQGEWKNSSDGSYCKANRSVCQLIDHALDVFIVPLMNYRKKAPDPAAVEAGYNDLLDKLRQAE
jgi:hypothetical protein